MNFFLLTVPLLLLAACANEPRPVTIDQTAQTCEREYRVGSSIPTLVCSGPKTEAERQQMLDDLRNQVRPSPAARNPG